MKRHGLIVAAALAAACAAGCSTTGTPSASEDEKVYVTGSRIPKNDRAGVRTSQDQGMIRDSMRTAPPVSGGVTGAI